MVGAWKEQSEQGLGGEESIREKWEMRVSGMSDAHQKKG